MTDLSIFKNRTPRVTGESSIRHSAVMIPVLDLSDGPHLLFEVRSEKLEHQPGDICFPGGGIEEGETPEEAAVREAEEELLVTADQIEMIGPADTLSAGARHVYSFVCRLRDYRFEFSGDEVAEVFAVPLSFFMNTEPEAYEVTYAPVFTDDFPFEKIHDGKKYNWRRQKDKVLFYEYEGHVIWGMTAKITNAFVSILKSASVKKDSSRADRS